MFQVNGAGKHGIVIFTLGMTGFDAATVPKEFINGLMRAFSRFPQRFIVRFQPQLIEFTPENVMVLNWIPQHDLLGELNRNYLLKA